MNKYVARVALYALMQFSTFAVDVDSWVGDVPAIETSTR
jgi:hypothetical protein